MNRSSCERVASVNPVITRTYERMADNDQYVALVTHCVNPSCRLCPGTRSVRLLGKAAKMGHSTGPELAGGHFSASASP
jgi:hypothetical protein